MAYKKHNWVVGLDPITNKNLNELDAYVESLGEVTLPIASTTRLGGVKVGTNLAVTSDGTLSTADDVTIDNLFTNDEIEFAETTGDFGTNAKAKIQEAAGVPDATGHLNETLIHGTTGNSWSKVGANNMTSGNASYGQVPVADGNGAVAFADLEATQLDAGESTLGQVLTSDGDGSCVFSLINAESVTSGTATSGKVLTADGNGAASWSDVRIFYQHTISIRNASNELHTLYITNTIKDAYEGLDYIYDSIQGSTPAKSPMWLSVSYEESYLIMGCVIDPESGTTIQLYGYRYEGQNYPVSSLTLWIGTYNTFVSDTVRKA